MVWAILGRIQENSQCLRSGKEAFVSELKVALMTGTGQGIGRGCAIEMAKAGYKVSLMSPSSRSEELAEELGGIGRRGSVLDVDDLQAMIDDTHARIWPD